MHRIQVLSTLAAALVPGAALANTVAITELQNDVVGDENTLEWFEVFNYGTTTVDLQGYTIGDEDSDVYVIGSSVILPAGEVLVFADDPAAFLAEWGVGTIGVNVFDFDGALANAADELRLLDAAGTTVWSLAWADDDDAGYATWLTETDNWVDTQYGDKIVPGVVRAGPDVTGGLGYESGLATPDPNAFASVQGNIGSPLAGDYVGGGGTGGDDPTLVVTGSCPGVANLTVTNMTPGGSYAIVTGTAAGSFAVPGGPCAGTMLGLSNVTYRGMWTADANGERTLSPNLPGGVCGLFVQALDVPTCTPTNVTNLP